jgi:hypothetical protein
MGLLFRACSVPSLLLLMVFSLGGCEVLSVEPIIPESEAIFEERLLGAWEDVPDNEGIGPLLVSRAKNDGNTYEIHHRPWNQKDAGLRGRLGQLGEYLAMEVWAADESARGLVIGGHRLIFIDFVHPDELHWTLLDVDVLEAALDAGEVTLAYRRSDGRDLVLYDSSARIWDALNAYVTRPGVMQETVGVLRRIRDASRAGLGREPVEAPCFEAAPWPEADRMLPSGTPTASVDLGTGRILWLLKRPVVAVDSANSVAIQTGNDPLTAKLSYFRGPPSDGLPTPLFRGDDEEWLEFGRGVRVDERLLLFLARWVEHEDLERIERIGWTAILVENPDDQPPAWQSRRLEIPASVLQFFEDGDPALLHLGNHVYIVGAATASNLTRPAHAARWRDEAIVAGDLGEPEWWAGEQLGWVRDTQHAKRVPLFEGWHEGLTVHRDLDTGFFIAVYASEEDGAADLMIRSAPSLVGPWSDGRMVYRPPEYYRRYPSISHPMAHPELTGADLVLSYQHGWQHQRLIRLNRCRQGDQP